MQRPRPRILVFAGSTRADSLNGRLAALVARSLALREAEPTLISLADYPMPLYNGDDEAATGQPEAARKLRALMIAHQGVFIASPEYNQSVTPLLKNTLDWVSRIRPESDRAPSPWKGRIFALGAASPGPFAGTRSLMHLRHVLGSALGCMMLPEQIAIPAASTAFSADGGLANERQAAQLETMVGRLVEEAGRYG